MPETIRTDDIDVDARLYRFVNDEAMPGTGMDAAAFWRGFAALVRRLAPRNAQLLERRDLLQSQIDDWHRRHPGANFDPAAYQAFLRDIGYLTAEPAAFCVTTANVDPEISHVAGPQLVVPMNNARYALNAANARWGSLYDALYGTDAIAHDDAAGRAGGYNAERGARVIRYVRDFLDAHFTLDAGSHRDAAGYLISARGLEVVRSQGGSGALNASDAL